MRVDRLVIVTALLLPAASARGAEETPAQDPMEALFAQKCASCHTVGKGDRVGPDLKGAHERRDAAWLKRFISAPSAMLDSDPDARKLVSAFKGVRMPDLGLKPEQVSGLVALLERCSAKPCNLAVKFTPATKATADDIAQGQAIFVGRQRLAGGGPPCISCHTANGIHMALGGGQLAADLSHVFAKLGDEGIDAALRNPTFKLMNKVFVDHPLAEPEVFALRAFLYDTNRKSPEADDSYSLAFAGVLGALLVLILLNAAWSRRLAGVRKPLTRAGRAVS